MLGMAGMPRRIPDYAWMVMLFVAESGIGRFDTLVGMIFILVGWCLFKFRVIHGYSEDFRIRKVK